MGKVFVAPMSIATDQYIRKPLYVAAVRLTNGNFEEIAAWCQGEILQDEVPGQGTGKRYIHVRVHNPKNSRQTKAFVGDWLLYTERGYKVYTNKAFHASFDEVNSEPSSNGGNGETASYPYNDNGVIVLGPETFVRHDGSVLSWRGTNYVLQTSHEDIFMGSEEIMPGVTVNDAVRAVRQDKLFEPQQETERSAQV
jgi:hypothetical protein